MPRGQYGTAQGMSYGSQGGQYGNTQFGSRIELREPGHIGPTMSLSSQLSVSIGLEHTTVSDMELELPPHEQVTIDRFRSGTMAYYRDDRLLFSAKIEGVSVASDRTITLSGTAMEDVPLSQGEIVRTFEDTTIEAAIEEIGEDLPYDVRVKPANPRTVTEKTVQVADVGTGFEEFLQAGQDIDYGDRSTWRDLPDRYDDDVINTLHDTTPLRVDIDGITMTPTCDVIEAEEFVDDTSTSTAPDDAASGARAVRLNEQGDWIELEFAHEHTIPDGLTGINIRGIVESTSSGSDYLKISVDNSDVTTICSTNAFETDQYWWARTGTVSSNVDAVGDGDDPHTLRIEKIEGSHEIRIDCVAVHDRRFEHDPVGHTEVDENNALAEPGLYPRALAVVFDAPATGAMVDYAAIRDEREWRGSALYSRSGFVEPVNDIAHVGSSQVSRDGVEGSFYYSDATFSDTTRVLGVVEISGASLLDDDKPTTTPTVRTESQTVTDLELSISGQETAIISGEREFSGTPMDVLETLHNDAGRRFAIEHGVGPDEGPPAIMSFETRDSDEIRSTANWVVTDVQRDADVSDYANQVTVVGAPLVPGSAARASATARDESEIESLRDPPDDDGVRPITIRDESLETVNDCLSKARSILQERVNADKRGGSVTTAPILPTPGPQYLTEFFGSDSVGGWGLDWGQSWGATRIGHHSALESATFTEEAGSAQTEMEFEKFSGLYKVVTEV